MSARPTAVVLMCLLAAAAGHAGQGASPTARELYTSALTREQSLRAIMNKTGAPLRDYRAVVAAYDTVVRRFPASGYVDNALWQGAGVAIDAFERFSEDRDRATARRMLELLASDYPASPYVARARETLKKLAPPAPPATPEADRPAQAKTVLLRSITRTTLPNRVVVTIELDSPAVYHAERAENPKRVFIDFAGTALGESMSEGTHSYDEGIVRRVRVGLHANHVTRVVLDLDGVASYDISVLERPYRVVVACERTVVALHSPPAAAATPPPAERPASSPPHLASRGLPSTWGAAPAAAAPDPEWLRVQAPPLATTRPDPPAASRTPAPRETLPESGPTPAPAASAPKGPVSLARQLGLGASKIVIDPGHGGHDPGALGAGVSEADIVLDVSLRLESLLRGAGVEVVLTRRSDDFVPLEERPAIATREQADLFLSIHANASRNRSARGIETYFLNFSTDPDAEAVAARENAATGRTINSLPAIVKAITLNSKLDESRSFATLIQRAMAAQLSAANRGLIDHGVKQAPFVVLIGAAMPSVLVEISFITNVQEGRLLKSGAYRQKIAQALFDAVRGYQRSLKSAQVLPPR